MTIIKNIFFKAHYLEYITTKISYLQMVNQICRFDILIRNSIMNSSKINCHSTNR